jgi:hypothetical protein
LVYTYGGFILQEEQTPLHVASRLGNVDIVMLLLQHGAAVDATTKDLYTPLHIAAKEGQEEVSVHVYSFSHSRLILQHVELYSIILHVTFLLNVIMGHSEICLPKA